MTPRQTKSDSLSFWHTAGDIIWSGDGRPTPIDLAQADALRELFADEAFAAETARDWFGAVQADRLWAQIHEAIVAQSMWVRAS